MDNASGGRDVARRNRRRRLTFVATAGFVAIVTTGVAAAAAVAWPGERDSAPTESLSSRALAPSTPSVITSPVESASPVAPSASAAAASPTTKAQRVVPGQRLVGYSPKQLALRAERAATARAARAAASKTTSLTLGTMNVLASQHTGPHGDDHRGWPSAARRTPIQAAAIRVHGADVVGLQEAKPDQLNGLVAATGYKAFPGYEFGSRDTDNSILYDPSKFDFVSGTSFQIVFMHGPRPQTVLKLRDKQSGREMYFVNMHTSAGHDGAHTATRHAGMSTAVGYINRLKAEGLPVFVTGDMNDRAPFRSRVLAPASLTAAIDGGWRARNFGPGWMAVDWVASTPQVSWSDFWVEEFQRNRTSDHYFITAHATLAGTTS